MREESGETEKSYLASISEADWIARGYRIITESEYQRLIAKNKPIIDLSLFTRGQVRISFWMKFILVTLFDLTILAVVSSCSCFNDIAVFFIYLALTAATVFGCIHESGWFN